MLSDKQIKEFQKIYKKEFNKEISQKEAFEKGSNLIRLVEIVYKPIKKHKENERANKNIKRRH